MVTSTPSSTKPNDQEWSPDKHRYGYIDGDLLIYSGAARYNDDDTFDNLADYLDGELDYISGFLGLDDFRIFLSAGGNYRYEINPEYKANRRTVEKPKWLGECYRYFYQTWGAKAERSYEADDLLGIAITDNPNAVLCSYDKDLNQIPGWHFNWRKNQLYHVTEAEAERFLAIQCLAGDPTDNIPGIKGIGPKKAEAILGEPKSLHSYLEAVVAAYYEKGLDFGTFAKYYKCLKILRNPVQEWPELRELPGYKEE